MAERLEKARGVGDGWISSGKLEFLNAYHYKMGGEILTPFGRQQLCEFPDRSQLTHRRE